jgi:hypothetical protein
MLLIRTALVVAVVLALAPGEAWAAKPIPKKTDKIESGADGVCKKWLGAYLRSGDEALLVDDAKVRVLWHKPEKKHGKFVRKTLGKFKGQMYWDSVASKKGKEMVGCVALVGLERVIGKGAWLHTADVYARYDLVKEGGKMRGSRVSLVLVTEQNDKTGDVFERPLDSCNVVPGAGSIVPDRLCGLLTIHDTPKGGPSSEVWITRDISEVLVFTKGGHLASYTLLGVLEQTDDGMAPMGMVDVQTVDLGLGEKVLSVREEKVSPMGKGKGECAPYMVETTLGYYTLSGGKLAEIFSQVVDVFPDAPCASDEQLDKWTDIYVEVEISCKGEGPCDLLLRYDQATPKEKYWNELWKYDGKKYKKVKTMKGEPLGPPELSPLGGELDDQ